MIDPIRHPELFTPTQMAAADRLTITCGTPGIVLMERAGKAVADVAERMTRGRGRITVCCGPGGNGGDGFVAARLLAQRGFAVSVGLLGSRDALKGDAVLAAAKWRGPTAPLEDLFLRGGDVIIDALYGGGLRGEIEGVAALCIERIASARLDGAKVLAVDVPSGLDGETGRSRGCVIGADATVTFHRLKPGHALLPGRDLCGRIVLADIGLHEDAARLLDVRTWLNAPSLWRATLPRLTRAAHKYSRGSTLVLSGAAGRTGAARLAAHAALRSGAGLVTIAAPPDAVAALAAHCTAVMIAPFQGPAQWRDLLEDPRRNSVLLGPAAGVSPALRSAVEAALVPGPWARTVILDADVFSAFAGDAKGLADAISAGRRGCIATPHEGEFMRLFKNDSAVDLAADKLTRARAAARSLGATVVLKGADTVVAAPDGRATIAWDAPPQLATAGSGDVLAGVAAGLAAQGMPPFEAACAAVWVHAEAGRSAGVGLIADDLPERVGASIVALRD